LLAGGVHRVYATTPSKCPAPLPAGNLKLIEELKNDNDTPDHWNSGGISPSAPNIIEDELLQQFDRMELQVLALYDTRMGEQHQILKDEGN